MERPVIEKKQKVSQLWNYIHIKSHQFWPNPNQEGENQLVLERTEFREAGNEMNPTLQFSALSCCFFPIPAKLAFW